MTDNEIIKALECCYKVKGYRHIPICQECPLKESRCAIELPKNALALINRQKAEIERLEREIEDLESTQEISPEAKHFVDTKADKVISLMNELIKSQDQIKADAVKEFAERMKAIRRKMYPCYVSVDLFEGVIDNLVKEFTGGQK
jgi:hypothetical protein